MATKARAVQVPGEPTQDLPPPADGDESRPVLDADAVAQQVDVLHAQQAAEVNQEVAALRAQLEAAQIAHVEAEQRAAIAEEKAQAALASAAAASPAVAAPAVTGKATPTPKLTAAGWVVPQAYGAPPVKA